MFPVFDTECTGPTMPRSEGIESAREMHNLVIMCLTQNECSLVSFCANHLPTMLRICTDARATKSYFWWIPPNRSLAKLRWFVEAATVSERILFVLRWRHQNGKQTLALQRLQVSKRSEFCCVLPKNGPKSLPSTWSASVFGLLRWKAALVTRTRKTKSRKSQPCR